MEKTLQTEIECANKMYTKARFYEAFDIYFRHAEKGDAYSSRMVGWMFLIGRGVHRDIENAIEFLSYSAEFDDPQSKFGLAKCYMMKNQYDKALDIFFQLSEEGFFPADYWLGHFYENGISIGKDNQLAFEHYSRASKQKHLHGTRRMAYMLLKGCDGWKGRPKGLALLGKNLLNGIDIAKRQIVGDRRLLT